MSLGIEEISQGLCSFKKFYLILQSRGIYNFWELTLVPLRSQTTLAHSIQGKVRDCEPFPPRMRQSCTEEDPLRIALSASLLPVGKNSACLIQVVLKGGGRGALLPESQDPKSLEIDIFLYNSLPLLISLPQTLCSKLCVGGWRVFRDAKFSLFPRSVQFRRDM